MKYLILIYINPASREAWEQLPEADRAAGLDAYAKLTEDLAASGELIVTEALADASQGRRVTRREGRPVVSDGPFAEAKEALAGFFLIECESIERAIEVAARVPDADVNLIEVRPVMELGGFEM
jgi:hypothetical protein